MKQIIEQDYENNKPKRCYRFCRYTATTEFTGLGFLCSSPSRTTGLGFKSLWSLFYPIAIQPSIHRFWFPAILIRPTVGIPSCSFCSWEWLLLRSSVITPWAVGFDISPSSLKEGWSPTDLYPSQNLHPGDLNSRQFPVSGLAEALAGQTEDRQQLIRLLGKVGRAGGGYSGLFSSPL